MLLWSTVALGQPGADLAAAMQRRGVASEDVILPFVASAAIADFAAHAAQGKGARERAGSLYEALLQRIASGAIERDRQNEPKARPPKTATQVWEGKPKGPAGCYELSALFVAAARAAGLDAVGAVPRRRTGDGRIGHVVAGVRADGELLLFDLQNGTRPVSASYRVLDDLSFVGHHYNHQAVSAELRGHPRQALRYATDAVRLGPTEPSFLNNRSHILLELGELHLAYAEAVAAVRLAPDVAVYWHQLGRVLLADAQPKAAADALEQALALWPSGVATQRDLGWAFLLLRQDERARQLLERAKAGRMLALAYLVWGDVPAARRTAQAEHLPDVLAYLKAPASPAAGDVGSLVQSARRLRDGARGD